MAKKIVRQSLSEQLYESLRLALMNGQYEPGHRLTIAGLAEEYGTSITPVREAIRVPLVVNGDIADARTANEAITLSGADAVMVGRASYGAPWLAGAIAGHAPPAGPAETVRAHYEDMLSHYGAELGMRQARKHLGWYLDTLAPATPAALKREMMTSTEPGRVLRAIASAFGNRSGGDAPVRRAA